jgi:hypothetical protein
VKPLRWSPHALNNLADREIDRAEAEKTLEDPEFEVPGQPPRRVLMRRYFDQVLRQEMLLRIVVEDTTTVRKIITLYKTSQINKYLKEVGL